MYITVDLEPSDYDTDLMTVRVVRNWTFNKREYMADVTTFMAPKYQAICIQNSLKSANPEDYPKSNVLQLIKD